MPNNPLRAGAGKATIEIPDEFFPQEQFSRVHDPLHVRVVLLESDCQIALVSLEMTSLPGPEVELLKRLVHDRTGIRADGIWICVTHSFSSPHFLPPFMLQEEGAREKVDFLRQAIHQSLEKAIELAIKQMKMARLGIGSGTCNINVNRDILTNKGWWIGMNTEGSSDKTITVLRIDAAEEGATGVRSTEPSLHENVAPNIPMAVIFHYSVQSSVMDGAVMADGMKEITSDLVGKASEFVESFYEDNAVAMFLIGAAGDQAPIKKAKQTEVDLDGEMQTKEVHEQGYDFVTELGKILGQETIKIADQIANEVSSESTIHISTGKQTFLCPGQKMIGNIHSLQPTFVYDYITDQKREMSVEAIQLGEILLLGTQPELTDYTASEIRKASPFVSTLVMTMVNGGAKYMADQEAYNKLTYESMNSTFGKGAAEILTENAIDLMNQMKNKI